MLLNKETAITVSDHLLKIQAIKLNNENPFTWASGMRSPIYCDNRVTLSYPEVRLDIRDAFISTIKEKFSGAEAIVGVATGGIAQGALIAQEMDLPFAYVRSTSKGHGLENQIEGVVKEGQKVVVIEDLVSTGGSSLKAVTALRAAGCDVLGMVAIFTYQLPKAKENFEKEDCTLFTLADYETMIGRAADNNYIKDTDMDSLSVWRQDPKKWAERFQ